mmetsp:Transcript_4253/g.6342  ORF Transcript_4253/g.6342 Transcript_4253/m.6342 type:complete len:502 (+) Transcript_4253:55-1560(+)
MLKKRHVYAPILPTQQNDNDNEGEGHLTQKQKQKSASNTTTCFRSLRFFRHGHAIHIVIIGTLIITLGIFFCQTTPIDQLLVRSVQGSIETVYNTLFHDKTSYGPPANLKSEFLSTYEEMLTSDKGVTIKDLNKKFVPLLLDNGKLLCRRRHKHKLSWFRARKFIQMIRMGLIQQKPNSPFSSNSTSNIEGGLPILLTEGDDLYCNVVTKQDHIPFPRLSWSIVAPKHGNWCQSIGIPSYSTWLFYHRNFQQQSDWVSKFQQNDKQYPWSNKSNNAVWRGSTTYDGYQYNQLPLNETPRGQLVKKSMEHPELIDAGFTRLIQKFENDKKAERETSVSKGMSMSDMMKYKAIIDIDGNNWSSRFGPLLCMNSVVIKIDPDFIEYFYKDLQPMVHYIPATLQNLTQAVEYAIDKDNERQVQSMIKAANTWCQDTLIEPSFVEDAMTQLVEYQKALEDMDESWREEWESVKKRFTETLDDFVDCDDRNVVSYISDFFFHIYTKL